MLSLHECLVSAERYTVHLRAVCPEGAGRSASRAQREKGCKRDGYLNTRARQVLRLVLQRPIELEHLLHELTHRTPGYILRRMEAKTGEQGARVPLEIAVAGFEHFEGRELRYPTYVDDKQHQNLAPYRSALVAGKAAGNGRRYFDLELEIRSGLRRRRRRR